MNNFLKNRKRVALAILIILSTTSLIYILSLGHGSNNKAPLPTPQTSSQATYESITPGVSTKEDVLNKLGKPIITNQDMLEFKSLSPNRNNEVIVNQDKVSLIKQIITLKDTERIMDITKVYGVAQKMLYGPDAGAGFYLFVYPSNGIAYIGNAESDILLEVWYFAPTDLTSFETNYANGYSENNKMLGPEGFN